LHGFLHQLEITFMTNLLFHTIEQIGREKGIAPETIILAVEEAMVTAAKKFYKTDEELVAHFNRESGIVEVFIVKRVVKKIEDELTEISLKEAQKIDPDCTIDSEIQIQKSTEALGRIAAQTAKQVIYQKVREAERENIYNEYSERINEIINGSIKRFERKDIIIDLGKTEALLPFKEQCRMENYNQGDRIRAVIIDVLQMSKGPQVIVSRTDAALLVKLFEMEVPEIYDGTVILKNAVREPGDRAKVAAASRDGEVDPVGACVGMKGSRVHAIIRELRKEKIDIVAWSADPTVFAANALNPAKVSKVTIVDQDEKILEVIVDESQLSLAIGKKGQNVRLAAKLIGWKIDIKSEEDKKREVEEQMSGLAADEDSQLLDLPGIGKNIAGKLIESGIENLEKLKDTTLEQLTSIPGIGKKTAEKLIKISEQDEE